MGVKFIHHNLIGSWNVGSDIMQYYISQQLTSLLDSYQTLYLHQASAHLIGPQRELTGVCSVVVIQHFGLACAAGGRLNFFNLQSVCFQRRRRVQWQEGRRIRVAAGGEGIHIQRVGASSERERIDREHYKALLTSVN